MLKRSTSFVTLAPLLVTIGFSQSLSADQAEAEEMTATLISAVVAADADITQNVTLGSVAADSMAVSLLVGNHDSIRLIGKFEPLGVITANRVVIFK